MDGPLEFGFQWHLTDRCNLRCGHCYQERFDPASERPLVELEAIADGLLGALSGARVSINLTGGEPLLFPGFFALIEHLEGFEQVVEINVITNGTRSGDEVLRRLSAMARLGVLKVSVESAETSVNDGIRGEGNLERVSRGVERFTAAGLPVVLMMTLSARNVETLAETARWARSVGAAGVIFERFVPLGSGRAMARQVLSSRQWRRAVEAIARVAGLDDVSVDDLLGFRAFWLELGPEGDDELRGALCNLGEGSMALMPDGTVYPCRRLPIPVGRLPEAPFSEILGRLAEWAPASVKPWLSGSLCRPCQVEGCAGCRALARALLGDNLADDVQCYRGG